ncbi:hypothetical protein EII25_07075 [Erysipelotrichaceae bacterium OH741_COT-311]|nr:AAA family ATPase [Erysipelotrichaceae bacterium]RRC91083.1 hypothetical protein EII25_07075 [Erysipelotrichaceae bacterium OH741_COT-311]
MAIRIALFGDSFKELEKVESKLTDHDLQVIHKSINLSNASDEVAKIKPNMVIILCSESNWAFRACQQIYLLYPNVVNIMLSNDASLDIAKRVIDAGAMGFIAPIPENNAELCESIKKTYFNELSRISMLLENSGIQRKSEIFTVFGTKGGIGKTTFAVNLAVSLARKKAKVAILDLDLQFGDAHMFLGLDVKETVAELLQEQRVPTIDGIRNYFVVHSSGVQLLGAPASPEYADGITASLIEPIINTLRTYYDYIIIDTSAEFSELNLLLIEEASKVFYITGLDISLLNNAKKGLLLLDSLNLKDKINIVVSKDFKGDISIKDVEKIMGQPVIARIPHEYAEAVRALNQGIPIVNNIKKSGIAKEVSNLANKLYMKHKKHDSDDATKSGLKFPKFGGK